MSNIYEIFHAIKQHKDEFPILLIQIDYSSKNFFDEALQEDVELFLLLNKRNRLSESLQHLIIS
jgi:hypothetical protein